MQWLYALMKDKEVKKAQAYTANEADTLAMLLEDFQENGQTFPEWDDVPQRYKYFRDVWAQPDPVIAQIMVAHWQTAMNTGYYKYGSSPSTALMVAAKVRIPALPVFAPDLPGTIL